MSKKAKVKQKYHLEDRRGAEEKSDIWNEPLRSY